MIANNYAYVGLTALSLVNGNTAGTSGADIYNQSCTISYENANLVQSVKTSGTVYSYGTDPPPARAFYKLEVQLQD